MLSLNNNQPANTGAALNLSLSGAPQNNNLGQAQVNPWQQNTAAAASANPFISGLTNGQAEQWAQQPVAPPSELDINLAILQSLTPVESFVASPNMAVIVELLSGVVTLSIMEILRNCTFVMNEDDGTLKLDVTSLPTNLQTVSGENVAAKFNSLQSSAKEAVNAGAATRQQIAVFAQQSMMGGALQAALANEGLMEKTGNAAGSFLNRVLTGGR